jgi:hypothetical protein
MICRLQPIVRRTTVSVIPMSALGELSEIRGDEAIGTGIFSFMLRLILPISHLSTGESRVLVDQPETLQGGCGFTDPSGPLFSIYLDRAEGHDKKMTDRWKADADGILIFVSGHISCLFSRKL